MNSSKLFKALSRSRKRCLHHRWNVFAPSVITNVITRELSTIEKNPFSTSARPDSIHHIPENCNVPSFNVTNLLDGTPHLFSEKHLTGPRPETWYTGKLPKYKECPGVESDGKIYSLPQVSFFNGTCKKEDIQAYFDNTWSMTEVLLGSLQGASTFTRAPYHNLRHPMIFYYGHPAAFYINKLRVAGFLKDGINPYFEVIFETGVDEMSWDDLSKNEMAWPSVAEVHAYRQKVYNTVTHVIQNLTTEQCSSIDQCSPLWALFMGFEHERIHFETSSVLINELPQELVNFPAAMPSYHPSAFENLEEKKNLINPVAGQHYPVNEMVEVGEKVVSIGKKRGFSSFGWDNEYGYREFEVPAFRASKFKISNGEFLEFLRDGGYSRSEFWSEKGWQWRSFRNVKWPTFWKRTGPQGHHQYDLRLMFDTVPMPWDWPATVNYHEASAYAKWKGLKEGKKMRVLTELEHRAIRDNSQKSLDLKLSDDHAAVSGGYNMMEQYGYNINLSCSSMSPVNALPPNQLGFHDVFGNAWEWSEDYFSALPGFEVHPYYEDFSIPCFDGEHHIIQGGSFMSTGNEASVHSRFHFRPHFYQHASFRLVEVLDPSSDRALPTSDTDAPGPFVGTYPFRRSLKSLQFSLDERSNNEKSDRLNKMIRKNFSILQENDFFTEDTTLDCFTNFSKFRDVLLTTTEEYGVNVENAHVLEVGCGVGGLSFELARSFGGKFVGIDHNMEQVEIARNLFSGKTINMDIKGEGELQQSFEVLLPEKTGFFDISDPSRVDFRAADPTCLPAELKGFDLVVLNDVVDKISSPNALLGRLGGVRGLVHPGKGVLMVISSFQWDESTTPKSLWLGGYVDQVKGDRVSSAEALKMRLIDDFDHLTSTRVPLVWLESESDLRGKIYQLHLFKRK